MKVAIPHWQNRISPVFDVAANVWLVDIADGVEQARFNLPMESAGSQTRVRLLRQHGASVLICGAISRILELALRSAKIEVIGQTCGDVEQVLAAFLAGQLNCDEFRMPGCCGRGRHCCKKQRRGGSDER